MIMTRMQDEEGRGVSTGDTVTFSYGIPPVTVDAKIIERDGELIGLCPGHNPPQFNLRMLRRYVGRWHKNTNKGFKAELKRRAEGPIPCPIPMVVVDSTKGDGLAIPFKGSCQYLGYNQNHTYFVSGEPAQVKQCKLIPVEKPKAKGGTYFGSDKFDNDFTNLRYYHKYMGDDLFAWIDNRDVRVTKEKFSYWWKVVAK